MNSRDIHAAAALLRELEEWKKIRSWLDKKKVTGIQFSHERPIEDGNSTLFGRTLLTDELRTLLHLTTTTYVEEKTAKTIQKAEDLGVTFGEH